MGWFKYQTTKAVNAPSAEKTSLCQRGHYEHVIRSQQDHLDCAAYIQDNLARWLERQGGN